MKPNCYDCIHRRSLPGNAHSECAHPATQALAEDRLAKLLSMFGGGGLPSPAGAEVAASLGIKANPHGIFSGWFAWPCNFDPTWLEACNGFEAKAKQGAPHA